MISFVIPAYNEELLLGRTLNAVHRAGVALRHPFEVVVADDGSTDRTADVAHQHRARVVAVRHRQIAATRNAGAAASTGELLIFVDADTVVTLSAVRGAVLAMRRGAVGGGCAVRFEGQLPLFGQFVAATTPHLLRALGIANGCFLFCTRAAFLSAGRFNESLFAAEEGALSLALHRQGRFVLLHQHVVTSGRKLRTFSSLEILSLLAQLAMAGPGSLRRREGLDVWYGERRRDSGER